MAVVREEIIVALYKSKASQITVGNTKLITDKILPQCDKSHFIRMTMDRNVGDRRQETSAQAGSLGVGWDNGEWN